jgi:hypothetical protein
VWRYLKGELQHWAQHEYHTLAWYWYPFMRVLTSVVTSQHCFSHLYSHQTSLQTRIHHKAPHNVYPETIILNRKTTASNLHHHNERLEFTPPYYYLITQDILAKAESASALCFHPHKNIINIAAGNEIFGMHLCKIVFYVTVYVFLVFGLQVYHLPFTCC